MQSVGNFLTKNKILIKKVLILVIFSFLHKSKLIAQTLRGTGTYYANKFVGRKTATGEIYKHTKLTAASNNFKLGSLVRVTNMKNGNVVEVKINDRMHPRMSRKGRVIDLSLSAFKMLSNSKNLLNVQVKVI